MSEIKPRTPSELDGYYVNIRGDEYGATVVHSLFRFAAADGDPAGEAPIENLPQAARDALDAFHAALWGKAEADNPDYESAPKEKRKQEAEAKQEKEAAEAAEAQRKADEKAAKDAENAEPAPVVPEVG